MLANANVSEFPTRWTPHREKEIKRHILVGQLVGAVWWHSRKWPPSWLPFLQSLKSLAGTTDLPTSAHVARFPESMDATQGTKGKTSGKKKKKATLRGTLLHATTQQCFQWLMNNQRLRSTIPRTLDRAMASGTTRNEQHHARLNAHFREVTQIAQRTLAAETKAWLAADMATSLRMLSGQWSRKVCRASILPGVAGDVVLFRTDSWEKFVQAARNVREIHSMGALQHTKRRRTGNTLQAEIYDTIHKKLNKRRRLALFDAHN